eukprot:tig00020614_g12115.t1
MTTVDAMRMLRRLDSANSISLSAAGQNSAPPTAPSSPHGSHHAGSSSRTPQQRFEQEEIDETSVEERLRAMRANVASALDAKQRAMLQARKEGRWLTLKVFISSTFKDGHGERAAIARDVFPFLNAWGEARRLSFLPVDLRWGLREEETGLSDRSALALCLEEIDNARPLFVLLVGSRYGWQPQKYAVAGEPRFAWLDGFPLGFSLTHLEALYGFLGLEHGSGAARGTRALAYLRDPGFLASVPAPQRPAFEAEGQDAALRLAVFAESVRRSPNCTARNYTAAWGGVDAQGAPLAGGLERFVALLRRDLAEAAEGLLAAAGEGDAPAPSPSAGPAWLPAERAAQRAFAAARAAAFLPAPGSPLLDALAAYALDGAAPPAASDRDPSLLLLVGPPGCGKTTLMAALAGRVEAAGAPLASAFAGASPLSRPLPRLLRRLAADAAEAAGAEGPGEGDEWEAGAAAPASWLPPPAPAPGAHAPRVILALTEGPGGVLAALRARAPAPLELAVPALAGREASEIAGRALAAAGRPEPGLLAALLASPAAASPLALFLAADELRTSPGSGASAVAALPTTLEGLVGRALARVERAAGAPLAAAALGLLAASRAGLYESELRAALAPPDAPPLPPRRFAALVRAAGPLLRPRDATGDPLLDLAHRTTRAAVRGRYLCACPQSCAEAGAGEACAHTVRGTGRWRRSSGGWGRVGGRGVAGREGRPLVEAAFHELAGGRWAAAAALLADFAFLAAALARRVGPEARSPPPPRPAPRSRAPAARGGRGRGAGGRARGGAARGERAALEAALALLRAEGPRLASAEGAGEEALAAELLRAALARPLGDPAARAARAYLAARPALAARLPAPDADHGAPRT